MDEKFWFSKKSKRFLKNIDTFYYAVYFKENFTADGENRNVEHLREFCLNLQSTPDPKDLYFGKNMYHMIYMPGAFSCYTVRLCRPEEFDFFFAPTVATKDTPVGVLQLRSRPLWEKGAYGAFEDSLQFLTTFARYFEIEIREVRENRCDFACHSNYLDNPEKFFERDHFVKMWVGQVGRTKEKTKHLLQHITVYDDDTTETDYIAIGKRGCKCFIRIYLKSKEVVQEGYKGFFLKIWYMEGMISRYDLYCLEEAYKRKSWSYLDIARLKWALDNDDTLSADVISEIKSAIESDKSDINEIHKLAKKYTKPVTKIHNVEFQVMRDMSKSFELIRKNEGTCSRVYDFLDNYELIYDYLTRVSLRLVRTDQADDNKSRRDNCEFWNRLRQAKTIEFKRKPKEVKLIRKYNSNLNIDVRKKRAISAVSSFGYAMTQDEDGNILDDASLLLSILNDNDIEYIDLHKKRLSSRKSVEIPDEMKPERRIQLMLISPDEKPL